MSAEQSKLQARVVINPVLQSNLMAKQVVNRVDTRWRNLLPRQNAAVRTIKVASLVQMQNVQMQDAVTF